MASQYIKVEKNVDKGYAIITIAKEPMNSLDTELCTALYSAIKAVESDAAMKGLIITSGLKGEVFCYGLDPVKELYAPNTSAEQFSAFWPAFSKVLITLYRSRLATLAAIKGAAPAGGCLIALCCEKRLMTRQGSGTIGLNEVAMGIPVPTSLVKLMGQVTGAKVAEDMVVNGRAVKAEEALQMGLVDELVASADMLLPRAEELMAAAVKLPSEARATTKQLLRSDFAQAWENSAYSEEAALLWGALSRPETVALLGAIVARLTGAGKSPGKFR